MLPVLLLLPHEQRRHGRRVGADERRQATVRTHGRNVGAHGEERLLKVQHHAGIERLEAQCALACCARNFAVRVRISRHLAGMPRFGRMRRGGTRVRPTRKPVCANAP